MANSTVLEILQYIPEKSFVHPTFWHKLAELKIDVDKLCDAPKPIYGYYTNFKAIDCLLEVDYSSFNTDFNPPLQNFTAYGTLYNKNTIEEFKDCDKAALLTLEGEKLLSDIKTGKILENPSLLARFFILSFADLKTHKYYFWFAFPASLAPTPQIPANYKAISLKSVSSLCSQLEGIYNNLTKVNEKGFFVVKEDSNKKLSYCSLKDAIQLSDLKSNFASDDLDRVYFCYSDSSPFDKPSWILRIFLTSLYYLCPSLCGKSVNVIGIRLSPPKSLAESLIWKVAIPSKSADNDLKFVGWEPNPAGKMSPRCALMAESMDPAKLAENSVNLNLKLMKWRLMPDLNLDAMAKTKCLLFGAGTLGCAVARNLLAWGFKNITFLDNGKVSYSNPIRQTLYKHEDAVNGHKMKATTAAERVQEINPNAFSQGFALQIPMPGHTVGDSMRESILNDLKIIEREVKNTDVLFLLTDSRESRWLPTVLGSFYKKMIFNAALGFDSYLVMRHGSHKSLPDKFELENVAGLHCIPGTELGCYFCNDVTAPGNSLKDRTLDQQCTVTRPGVSSIAASYAVELLVSILQHKLGDMAPAYYSTSPSSEAATIPEGLLGILPHSIRGMLGTFDNILPATMKFPQCIGCSQKVLNEYKERGFDFLFDVFDSAKYLEDLTSLSALKDCEQEIIECGDSDIEWSE